VYEKVHVGEVPVPHTLVTGVPDMTPVLLLIVNQVNPEGTLRGAKVYGPTPPVGEIVLLNG
jgi:hypothetical protein